MSPGPLVEDEVHVWHASLRQSACGLESLFGLLSDDERSKALRYYFRSDCDRYIAGRGILRSVLALYLQLPPEELRFAYSPYGKPSLETQGCGLNLRFNVSHSHEEAIYAVALGREVGLDIEFIRDEFASLQLAEQFFSRREVMMLRTVTEGAAWRRAFFNCWTRKEAYIKARGEGLSYPLDGFAVSLVPGEPASLIQVENDPVECSRWSLYEVSAAPGYVGALAVAGRPARIAHLKWMAEL